MNLNFWPKMYYSGGGGGGSGGTGGGAAGEQPPEEPTPVGAFRFNTDSAKLEYYDGNQWVNITTSSPEQHTGGTRGVMAGGGFPTTNVIDFVNIDSTGDAVNFGDLSQGLYLVFATASRSRGVYHGAHQSPDPTKNNTLEFITIATQGTDTQDFGDLQTEGIGYGAVGSGTRGIYSMANTQPTIINTLEYITIASLGNAQDYGDLTSTRYATKANVASPVRGIWAGGILLPAGVNTIDYVTIPTTGNAKDFGDLTQASREGTGCSNAVRGLFASGSGGTDEQIEYVTIATLGNAEDFGDLSYSAEAAGGGASPTRAIFAGGTDSGGKNIIDYVQIMTTGNAIDFGDRTIAKYGAGVASNGHGGIG